MGTYAGKQIQERSSGSMPNADLQQRACQDGRNVLSYAIRSRLFPSRGYHNKKEGGEGSRRSHSTILCHRIIPPARIPMNITTWNVNSIRKRLERVLEWVDARNPDVLCFQELKCVDEEFPRQPFLDRGYQIETYGQKTYNGVALLSRFPLEEVRRDLPWAGDSHARGISAKVAGFRVVNLYVPNGGELGSDKYSYKLIWLEKLVGYLRAYAGTPLLVCGDFNIAPLDSDTWDPVKWKGQVLCTEEERSHLRSILGMGMHDAFRRLYPERRQFTWWDYRGNGFQTGQGLRIDHHLVSEGLWGRVLEVSVDEEARARTEASDHAPVTLFLRDIAGQALARPSEPAPTPGRQIGLFG